MYFIIYREKKKMADNALVVKYVRVPSHVAELLNAIGPGIRVVTTCTYLADELDAGDEVDLKFVKDNLLRHYPNAIGQKRAWFCEHKLKKCVSKSPIEVAVALLSLSEYGVGLREAFDESCAVDDMSSMSTKAQRLCVRVQRGEVWTFHQLLVEPGERAVKRWIKARAVAAFLILHTKAAKTANHPARKRARGEFEI